MNRVDSSSLGSLTLSLPSVLPIPIASKSVRTDSEDGIQRVHLASQSPSSSSSYRPRRQRPKTFSPRVWYTVGISGGGVLSPRKPSSLKVENHGTGHGAGIDLLPYKCRSDFRRHLRVPFERTTSCAASATGQVESSVSKERATRTVATETIRSASAVPAPNHGQLAGARELIGHSQSPASKERRLILTASPRPAQTETLGKRGRGGNPSVDSTRKRSSAAKNPTASVGYNHFPGGIVFNPCHAGTMDIEPVPTSPLPARNQGAAMGPTPQGCGAADDHLGERTRGERLGGRVRPGHARPLVPRPTSARSRAECHPWHFSIGRFVSWETKKPASQPWRLVATAAAGQVRNDALNANVARQAGPTPLFPSEKGGSLAARLSGRRRQHVAVGPTGSVPADVIGGASSRRGPLLLSPERERHPSLDYGYGEDYDGKVIFVGNDRSLEDGDARQRGSGAGSEDPRGWVVNEWEGGIEDDDEPVKPFFRRKRVRSLLETTAGLATGVDTWLSGRESDDSEDDLIKRIGYDVRRRRGSAVERCSTSSDSSDEDRSEDYKHWDLYIYGGDENSSSSGGRSHSPGLGDSNRCSSGNGKEGKHDMVKEGDPKQHKTPIKHEMLKDEKLQEETPDNPEVRHDAPNTAEGISTAACAPIRTVEERENERKSTNEAGRIKPSKTSSSVSGRSLLGDAGVGNLYVARGLGKVQTLPTIDDDTVQNRTSESTNGRIPLGAGGTSDIDVAKGLGVVDEQKGWKNGRNSPERATGRAGTSAVAGTPGVTLEAKRKARAMLKDARGLIGKGQLKRAHAVLNELIKSNGGTSMSVVLRELRARVRASLGLWEGAGKDVKAAMAGLDNGDGYSVGTTDSEEEKTWTGQQRWRAIVNRVVLRRDRNHKATSFSITASSALAARRGLRARVMLVGAKCFAQENKLESAIDSTCQVRALAARRSALPGGHSGVPSSVAFEAFKLEIKWLEDAGQLDAAVVVAQEMAAHVKRCIADYNMKVGNRQTVEDDELKENEKAIGRDGKEHSLWFDEETEEVDPDAMYEAAMWAKVAFADLTTRKVEQQRPQQQQQRGGECMISRPSASNAKVEGQDSGQGVTGKMGEKSPTDSGGDQPATSQDWEDNHRGRWKENGVGVDSVGCERDEQKGQEQGGKGEEDTEFPPQTGEENWRDLEAAIEPLQSLLVDQHTVWRVDLRTPQVLANALEKLADMAEDPDESDAAQMTVVATTDPGKKFPDAVEGEGVPQIPTRTRHEALTRGEQCLRAVFEALEAKLSSLVATWTPVRRPSRKSVSTPSKRTRRGGGVRGGKREHAKASEASESLRDKARDILLSVAEIGINMEAHKKRSGILTRGAMGGGIRSDIKEEVPLGSSYGQLALGAKDRKTENLSSEQEMQLTQLLKVLELIPVILERRAHFLELAGADPEGILAPLLEEAIEYSCLPRVSPPGDPSLSTLKLFGDGVSTPASTPADSSDGKNQLASSSAMHVGDVAGVDVDTKFSTEPAVEKTCDDESRPVTAEADDSARLGLATPLLSTSRQVSASDPFSLASTAVVGRKSRRRVAEAARAKAAEAAQAAARASANLLQWDADSLACLRNALRAMAATLLRMERKLETSGADSNLLKEQHSCSKLTLVGSDEKDKKPDGDGDWCGQHHHRSQALQSATLFERAEASLTMALAAAGVAVGEKLSTPTATPGNNNCRHVIPPWPHSYSRASTPIITTHDEYGSFNNQTLHAHPSVPEGNGMESVTNVAVLDGVAADGGRESKAIPATDTAPFSDPRTLAELYGMRCAAREGLGYPEGAFDDCLQAIAVVPEAPKFWAKAASLALQVAASADERKEMGGMMEPLSHLWASDAMRLASGFLQLCPLSYYGLLLRGQAAERLGEHIRAMRDYSRAQHVRPWSAMPALLRTRLCRRLEHVEEMAGGEEGESHAARAVDSVKAFLASSGHLTADDDGCSGVELPAYSRATYSRRGVPARITSTTVIFWKGRVKENERSYGQASQYYEQVFERRPTTKYLVRLASAYLGAMQPGKADHVLSKFLDSGPAVASADLANVAIPNSPVISQEASAPSPTGREALALDEGYSKARMLHTRALFALGKDEQYEASLQSALQGGLDKASVLFEWSLSEAISASMQPVESVSRELEETKDVTDACNGTASRPPPPPTPTGIAEWDSALLQDYHRRLRAEKERVAKKSSGGYPHLFDNKYMAANAWNDGGGGITPTTSPLIDQRRGDNWVRDHRDHCDGKSLGACSRGSMCEDSDLGTGESTSDRSSNNTRESRIDHNGGCDSDSDSTFGDSQSDDRNNPQKQATMEEYSEPFEDSSRRHPSVDNDEIEQLVDDELSIGVDARLGSQRAQDIDGEKQFSSTKRRKQVKYSEEVEPAQNNSMPPENEPTPKNTLFRRQRKKVFLSGYDFALELVTRCLRKDGLNANAYCLRAELETRLGRRDRTIADYRAAASLDLGNLRPRINMAVEHLNTSRSGLACVEFDAIERASEGSAERMLAAFNMGVAAATAGDLTRAEAAFTRALATLTTDGVSCNIKKKLVTPAICLENRGLVRLAMKRFRGAIDDLGGGGVKAPKVSSPGAINRAITSPSITGTGAQAAAATAQGTGGTAITGSGLQTLDCQLGRALAEARLKNRASREAARIRLRKLLRATRHLACEVASIRVGLGNLEATSGEMCSTRNENILTERANPGDDKQQRGEGSSGRALKHFLHAIHTCPTASAAWLNASEILETALEDGTAAISTIASIAGMDSSRDVGANILYSRARSTDGTSAAAKDRKVDRAQTKTTQAGCPSLALLDAVLAMAPGHHAALRCRATTLARLGRRHEALLTAEKAVAEAQAAVRACEARFPSVGASPAVSALRTSAPSTKNEDDKRTALPFPSPAVADRTYSGNYRAGAGPNSVSKAAVRTKSANEVACITAGSTHTSRRENMGNWVGRGDGDGGERRAARHYTSGVEASIGFMRSSKVKVVVGGLLPTGGGSAGFLDIIKSMILRGCIRQKMGRRNQAEEDYRQALGICHRWLEKFEGHLRNQRNNIHKNREDSCHSRSRAVNGTIREEKGVRLDRKNALGGRGGVWAAFERNDLFDNGTPLDYSGVTRTACPNVPSPLPSTSSGCEGGRDQDSSICEDQHRQVMKLESMIHHNMASLHLSALLGTDSHVSLRKEAIAREASEFVECEEWATSTPIRTFGQPVSLGRGVQLHHEHWWHNTVLAVAQMVTATGLGARPWRGMTTADRSNDPGRGARLHLGSAELLAKVSSGYDGYDRQALPGPLNLVGAARSRALATIRVNLAAAEKIGAKSPFSSVSASLKREGMINAIESISSAIDSMNTSPKLYIERARLLAMMDNVEVRGGQYLKEDYGKAAASDFATALWIDSHLERSTGRTN